MRRPSPRGFPGVHSKALLGSFRTASTSFPLIHHRAEQISDNSQLPSWRLARRVMGMFSTRESES